MGHNIHGFVAARNPLRRVTDGLSPVRVIGLPQGFAFLPINDDVLTNLRTVLARSPEAAGSSCDPPPGWDWKICPMLLPEEVRFARWFSHQDLIAWVETDYFGGVGFQAATAWLCGEAIVGPLQTGSETSVHDGAINQALRCIGVSCEPGGDEFDALRLGWHRDNEKWLARGRDL
jgi:hypothetical protein